MFSCKSLPLMLGIAWACTEKGEGQAWASRVVALPCLTFRWALLCCLQLSYGLSAEYSKNTAEDSAEKVDADRQIYAKYYVSQIMQLGEEGIRDAWSKVTLFTIPSRWPTMS